jgi:hypothetical protein
MSAEKQTGSEAKGAYPVAAGAYEKILMHALKYPRRPVCGLVLGKEVGKSATIEDSIPLFHNYPMSSMLELAMMQVPCRPSLTINPTTR